MKRFLLWTMIILCVFLALYNVLSEIGRAEEKKTGWVTMPSLQTRFETVSIGENRGKGNIIGIQPNMTAASYSTQFNFMVTLRLFLQQLQRDNLISNKTVIVFPEHIGTWLLAMHEKDRIYSDSSMNDALNTMIRSNLFHYADYYFSTPSDLDKKKHALFMMKSKDMAEAYQQTFSELSKHYEVTIVAGSIILPNPSLDDAGNLVTKKGSLFNISAVFGPDGKIIDPLIFKNNVPEREKQYVSPIKRQAPVFTTSLGNLSVLLGKDASDSLAYTPLKNKARFLVIPSLSESDSIHHAAGWVKCGAAKKAIAAGFEQGMHIFFSGNIWDQKMEGRAFVFHRDSLTVVPPSSRKGRIIISWIQ